jgi:hypothetical protein
MQSPPIDQIGANPSIVARIAVGRLRRSGEGEPSRESLPEIKPASQPSTTDQEKDRKIGLAFHGPLADQRPWLLPLPILFSLLLSEP